MKRIYWTLKLILFILFFSLSIVGCSGSGGSGTGSSSVGGDNGGDKGGDNGGDTGGNVGIPASIAKIAGDNQIAAPGTAVTVSPIICVMDSSGNPLMNATVKFSVVEGGGSVRIEVAETNTAGEASCGEWIMGMDKGPNSMTATVDGLAPAVFTATVTADVLLELGHADDITQLRIDGYRVLSLDSSGHWALWDYAFCSLIANGDSLSAELAGPTVVIGLPTGFEVRASSDGHVLSTITAQISWWKLASDGSYICAGSNNGLSAWTPTGQLLMSHTGDYSKAKSFATPGEVRIALGPKGANVVEKIAVQTGTFTVGPAFAGQFHSWFIDGDRFLTNVATTVWVYSRDSLQEAIFSLPTIENLTGQGGWVWTYRAYTPGYPLSIYAVGGDGTTTATYALDVSTDAIPSGTTIGVLPAGERTSVIDLSGSYPSRTDYVLPIAYPSAYAATSSSQWIIGTIYGVVLDGANVSGEAHYFGLGRAWSIDSGADRVAVATASGKILYLDAATNTLEGTIDFPSSKLEMSNDGTVLAAAYAGVFVGEYPVDRSLKVFSLPAGTVTRSWPYSYAYRPVEPFLTDFSLSRSGAYIGQVLETAYTAHAESEWDYYRQVSAILGGPPTWSDVFSGGITYYDLPIRLSPDGSLVAVSHAADFRQPSRIATNIFKGGMLATAVTGWAIGWIDDDRLLVNRYAPSGYGFDVYVGAAIYDPQGIEVTALLIPEITSFQALPADTVYSPEWNSIFSLSTGEVTWKGINSGETSKIFNVGAVAGSRVVYTIGSRVLSEPF